ncbi:hypothetical protein M422DRAFT_243728 [Sphaerobolus stellatus SS14]|nr:hypothetical protein M422DRAFT_243728 [Sphaerobolus stellatus SS14]
MYALSSNDNPSQPGLFELKDEIDCAALCGGVERNTPTPATQRFDTPYSVDSDFIIPLDITHISNTNNPRIMLINIPTHNPTPLFRLHTNHTPNPNPNIRIMPLLPTLHPHNIEMDLSLLGTDLFSDTAAAFA